MSDGGYLFNVNVPGGTDMCNRPDSTCCAVTTFSLPRRAVGASRRQDNDNLKVELDSHADTFVVGKNVLVIHEHDRKVQVQGYDPTLPTREAMIVDCALKYRCVSTGECSILVVNQALQVPELEHCLLCPMQCRMNGVEINETPKFLLQHPTNSSHSIHIHSSDSDAQPLRIPLRLAGVVSYFNYSIPTREEYEDEHMPRNHLTLMGRNGTPMTLILLLRRTVKLTLGVKLLREVRRNSHGTSQ